MHAFSLSFPIIANRIVPQEIWAQTKEELKEGNA